MRAAPAVTGGAVHPPPGWFASAHEVARRWWARRRSRDAVSLLSLFLVPCLGIPSIFVIGPLGGGGTPANMVGLGLLAWWVLEKICGGSRIDRRRQPLRIGVLVLLLGLAASLVSLNLRPGVPKEGLGAYRGLIFVGSLFGVLLVAADGIVSIERAQLLVRRVVLGVSVVAAIGILEFFTHVNPGRSIPYPGLVRNAEPLFEARGEFVRVQSSALHPIELGALLGMVLPVAVHSAFHTGGTRARRLAWVQVALIAAVLPMTLSRTGVIAATIGAVALFWQWGWRRRLRALVVSAAFVVGLRGAVPGLVGSVTGLFTHLFEDTSTTARTSRYGRAGELFAQHPAFGRGYNTLFPATGLIFDNSYLYFAVETGIVGLGCLGLFFAIIFFVPRGIRLRTEDEGLRDLGGLLSAMALTMPIMFATADMMSFNLLMHTYALLAGIGGAMWRLTGGPERAIIGRPRRHAGRAGVRSTPPAPAHLPDGHGSGSGATSRRAGRVPVAAGAQERS